MSGQRLGRVLITGGSGFIGGHLIRALSSRAGEMVIAADAVFPMAGARVLLADITKPGAIALLMRDVRPTTVFNLAGRRPRGANEDPREVMGLNLGAAIEVVKEATAAGVERIVLVGSAEEYGDQAMPVSEDAALSPLSAYGASKAEMTRQAKALRRSIGAPVTVVRPFSVYGPNAPLNMFVAEAVDCAARGQTFNMTDGIQKRDFVYISDVIDGMIAAALVTEANGEIFNLGSGVSHAMRDVAEALWRISGTSAELRVGARSRAAGDLMETRANIDKAKHLLGWAPRVSLDEGLRATWLAAQTKMGVA